MTRMGQPYTAGQWLALPGRADDLVAAWSDFTAWSLKALPGADSFVLVRHAAEPRRFLSVGVWSDVESVAAWRSSEGFRERLDRCRAPCEQFEGHDYTVVAAQQRR